MLTALIAAGFGLAVHSSPDSRATATEARMTDDERFRMLHGIFAVPFRGVPLANGVMPAAGHVAGVARLGVPDLVESDASLGVTNPLGLRSGDVATALPSGQAIAASFDPALAFRVGALIGAEARAKGINVLLGGGVNLARDPRGGRNFEYLGEDPLLAGTLAGAGIAGTQSTGVVATVKHFALNDQETLRSTLNARIDEAGLRESDLLAFQLAIERGRPGSVMCAYNRVNGPYTCGSDFLLNRVLKREWRYPGWVMSDWGAVHSVDFFANGLDQQSGSQLDDRVWFDAPLRTEVAAGRVSRARLSDAVHRILRSLYAVGADRLAAPTPIDYAAGAKVARDAAAAGVVVLKNDAILPLAGTLKHILVVGGHADFGVLSGGGSSQVTPSNGNVLTIPSGGPGFLASYGKQVYFPSSPLDALRKALPAATVEFDSGYFPANAVARAKSADLVVVFATSWAIEGVDAGSMALPEGQDTTIAALAAVNARVVVVLETGNPVELPWADAVGGIVAAWFPGQEGGAAIADVLTGAVEPSGRLPMSWPIDPAATAHPEIPGLGAPVKTAAAIDYVEGSDVGYRWFAAHKVLPRYPFGHGLGYTSFAYAGLVLAPYAASATLTVSNTGPRPGTAAPQLYLVAAAGRPVLRLAAFARAPLATGARTTLVLPIDPRLLARWDRDGWTIDGGEYVFAVGASAGDFGAPVTVRLSRRHWRD